VTRPTAASTPRLQNHSPRIVRASHSCCI
jgi:hypothetical protein